MRLHGVEDLRLDERDIPVPAVDEVVVKVGLCGICGTDLSFLKLGGRGGAVPQPLPLGHEFTGWVAALGDDVTGLKTGERVVVNPMADNNMIGFGDYAVVRHAKLGRGAA